MSGKNAQLGDALAYQDFLPVAIRQATNVPDQIRFNRANEINEDVLHNILLLEKYHNEFSEDETDRNSADLSYIDFKLNIILDLVLQLYASQMSMPDERKITLTATQFRCSSPERYQGGDMLVIELYLSKRFLKPLILYGLVDKIEPCGNSQCDYYFSFAEMSPLVQGLLERFIFLKHRRMIAASRREKSDKN